MLRRDDRDWLAALCADRGIALISDEVFADYPLRPGRDAASLLGEARALTFVLGGLSKSAGLPQVKLGWMVVSGPRRRVGAGDGAARDDLRHLSVRVHAGAGGRAGADRRGPRHSRADPAARSRRISRALERLVGAGLGDLAAAARRRVVRRAARAGDAVGGSAGASAARTRRTCSSIPASSSTSRARHFSSSACCRSRPCSRKPCGACCRSPAAEGRR